MILINRIYKALDQDIKLIYFFKDNKKRSFNFIFFILGTSNYIYQVNISKHYQECNCEDYSNGFFCKHINFVLFKLLKIFKIMKDKQIKLIFNNSLKESYFFEGLEFDEMEWSEFNRKFNKIKYFLKERNFKNDLYNKFKILHNNYLNFYHTYKKETNIDCAICLQNNKEELLFCPRCKNVYHDTCLIKWFEEMNKDNLCPICKDDSWDKIIKYMLLDNKHKINVDYI